MVQGVRINSGAGIARPGRDTYSSRIEFSLKCARVALRYGRAGARREETVDVDQVLLVLVSGLASGAVYGLMGLGLVIIIGRRTW